MRGCLSFQHRSGDRAALLDRRRNHVDMRKCLFWQVELGSSVYKTVTILERRGKSRESYEVRETTKGYWCTAACSAGNSEERWTWNWCGLLFSRAGVIFFSGMMRSKKGKRPRQKDSAAY